jgi:hypothetical protein
MTIELKPGEYIYKKTSTLSDYPEDYIEIRKLSKIAATYVHVTYKLDGELREDKISRSKIGKDWFPITPVIMNERRVQQLRLSVIYHLKDIRENICKIPEADLHLLQTIIERIPK